MGDATRRAKMSNGNDPIYVDSRQPATLHDGPRHIDYLTLHDAKIAWDRLPPERQQTATISSGTEIYTTQQINRLHRGPEPRVDLSAADAAQPMTTPTPDPQTQILSGIRIVSKVQAPRVNSAATVDVPAEGSLETSRGIPPVMQESLATSSEGIASGRDDLTASSLQVGGASIERTLSDQPVEIASAARALMRELAAQIEELKRSKPNDQGRLAQYDVLIPFLEKMAAGLGNLADALDRLVGRPEGSPEPVLLGKAADAARWLQKAMTEWLEANRTMVIDVPVRLNLFGFSVAFVHQLGIDNTAVTASLAYLAGLRSTQPRN
jgi:hypothetical protein